MKASALIRQRRSLGSWLSYAFPDDHDTDTRTPDPPERKEAGPPSPAQTSEPTPGTTPASERLP